MPHGFGAYVLVVATLSACAPSGTTGANAAGGGGGVAGVGGVGGGGAKASPIGAETTQLLSVVSEDWSSVPAAMQRYERAPEGDWQASGSPIPVVLGKSGLGWGRGLHPAANDGPDKQEGDGRSPAGIFSLGTAFGYAPLAEAGWMKLPYVQATADLECVDDPGSSHYNQLVHRNAVTSVDWSSSEKMLRPDALYGWGLFVDHNVAPTVPGAGSCIFRHIWSGASSSTAGCTATAETELEAVIAWLDPAAHPVLVQLPRAAFDAHRSDWSLP